MQRWIAAAVWVALASTSPVQGLADSPRTPDKAILLDDFEAEPRGWKFVGGEEFPGAKGSLIRDTTQSHGGKASYKLSADFRGGGAYVGVWKDMEALEIPDIKAFHVWIKSTNVDRIGVRLVDGSDQCHQGSVALPDAPGEWREVVLKIPELVGGEHWGGLNDGKWHGSIKGLGLNLGKTSVGKDSSQGTLWIDDLSAEVGPTGTPKLLSCVLDPPSCRPAYGTRITYRWEAEPLGKDYTAFVHIVDSKGKIVMQDDHEPPVPTRQWSGKVEYSHTVVAPTEIPEGDYRVMLGLYDRKTNQRASLKTGTGVAPQQGDEYQIGVLKISADAPLPKLPSPSLDLKAYRLTFDEDFNAPLSISATGPGTRWIAHTPYFGDFGDAGFGNPEKDSPFSVKDGILHIEARKQDGKWRSGLICSVDPKGEGFSQKFGYFEMRAKLPKGLGTWPAFWLMGTPQLKEPRDKKTLTQVEIDVLEQYGVGPNALHTTLHLWGPGNFHWARGETHIVGGMTDDFHTYGVSVEDDFLTFYFDGVELRKDPTPKEARVPLYLMVDLALGGGWPIDRTPNPSVMLVDYVRAYARK